MKDSPDAHIIGEDSIEYYVGSVGNHELAESGLIDLCSYVGEIPQQEDSLLNAVDRMLGRFI